jgi:hypothetical protein
METHLIPTKRWFIRWFAFAVRIALILSACNFPTKSLGLAPEETTSEGEDENGDSKVITGEEDSDNKLEEKYGPQCPQVGDQLYFFLVHQYIAHIGPWEIKQRTFRETPYVLDVKEFKPTDHPTGDVSITDSSIYQPGFSQYTEATIEEVVFTGYGDIDVSVHGYCENSYIYLYITEEWHDYTVYSLEAGSQPMFGKTTQALTEGGTEIARFYYFNVMEERGDIDSRDLPPIFDGGQHAWQLFGHVNNAYDCADFLTNDQIWMEP